MRAGMWHYRVMEIPSARLGVMMCCSTSRAWQDASRPQLRFVLVHPKFCMWVLLHAAGVVASSRARACVHHEAMQAVLFVPCFGRCLAMRFGLVLLRGFWIVWCQMHSTMGLLWCGTSASNVMGASFIRLFLWLAHLMHCTSLACNRHSDNLLVPSH